MSLEKLEGNKTPESERPEWLSMYDVPSHKQVTKEDWKKYRECSEVFDREAGPSLKIEREKQEILDNIWQAQEKEKANLIQQVLNNPDIKIQEFGASMIQFAPKEEVVGLIEKALESPNIEVQSIGASMIGFAPEEEVAGLIEKALESPNIEVQSIGASMIGFAPIVKRKELIEKALENPNPKVQINGASIIYLALEKDKLEEIVTKKVENALGNSNIEVQSIGASMIKFAPKEEVVGLIEKALESPNIEVQSIGASMIKFAPNFEKNDLQIIVTKKVKDALENSDIKIQKGGAFMIKFALLGEIDNLLKIAKEKIGDKIIEPPLYEGIGDGNNFLKRPFKKTGSETTLLGKDLKDKLILRHITIESFLAWKKAYENHQFWKDNGFDYVPIEPISRFKLDKKNNEVDVASGVLDLSLANWINIRGNFILEIIAEIEKIKKLLGRLSIIHGHDNHYRNFCLRFFRNKDGSIDFNTKPRVYIIDFDMAKIIN